jgi:diguanylate cyclase (GGDEF)-like protein
LAGDSVLRELSEAVRETIRKDDLFVRWGGDEFLIVSMITVDEALCIADRLRRNIEGRRFSGFNVTVSVGISRLLTDEPLEEGIKRADRALYNAKAKGKNSVAVEDE